MSYRVVLSGAITPGSDLAEVRRKFMSATGQTEELAVRLLSGTPSVIKRNLSQTEAERIAQGLNGMGAVATAEIEAPLFALDEGEVQPATPAYLPPGASTPMSAPAAVAVPVQPSKRGVSEPTAFTPHEELTDERMYRAIIGPKRTDYYLRFFTKRDQGGGFLSWNWPCVFVQFLWALYRKCWGFAFGGLLMAVLFGVIAGAIYGGIAGAMGASMKTIDENAQWIGSLASIFVAAFANGFYHRRAKRLIRSTSHIADPNARLAELTRRGGTSSIWIWLFVAISLIGILAAIAIPAYQDYLKRARPASMSSQAEPETRTSTAPPAPDSTESAAVDLKAMSRAYDEHQYEVADRLARQAATLPGTAGARGENMLGILALEAQDLDAAIEHFNVALLLDPNAATVAMNLASAYERAGSVPRAIAAYEKALALDPNKDDARAAVARLKNANHSPAN